mmetsp:Transcript_24828/g.44656  ORF Transcript_24828/g.44656 Transcript_24828/m.44656 type:complete len:370 (+) Transcript_24828:37-1146(+)
MVSSSIAILALCLCLICIPMTGCSAFHQQHTIFPSLSRSSYRTREPTCIHQSTTSSSSTDKNIFYNINISDNDDAHEYQGEHDNIGGVVELWLDLRGTSLTPKAVLKLWHLEERQNNQQQPLENNNDTTADSLLAKAPFVKCLMSPNEKFRDSPPQKNNNENEQHIDVLFVAEKDGGDMNYLLRQANRSPSSTSAPDSIIGRILSLQASSSSMPILPDPLPAMEVASKGQWIILDTNGWKKIAEDDRISNVLSLAGLISSGSNSGGGIGLTCHTNNEVVKAAMFIQSMTNNGGGGGGGGNTRTKTLESGIVIPDDDDDDAEMSSGSGSGIRKSGKRTNFAIIVPYDVGLLQTATLLLDDNCADEDRDII